VSSEARQGRAAGAGRDERAGACKLRIVAAVACVHRWQGWMVAEFPGKHIGLSCNVAGVSCSPLNDELRAGLLLRQGHDTLQGHHLQATTPRVTACHLAATAFAVTELLSQCRHAVVGDSFC
jgi:hypothetical protein